jgi:hypothetical protein
MELVRTHDAGEGDLLQVHDTLLNGRDHKFLAVKSK